MKILISSTYNKGATINRVEAFATILAQEHQVKVLLPTMDNLDLLPKNPNLKYQFIDPPKKASKNLLVRYLSEFLFSLKYAKAQKNSDADIEFITIPFMALIITSQIFKRKSKRVLDIRDLVWEYIGSNSFFTKITKYLLRKINIYFINKYDQVSLTNQFEYDWVRNNTRHKNPIFIPNGILKSQFQKIELTKESPIKDKVIITYLGNVGLAQNLVTFIDAIRNFKNIEFRIIGDGNDYQRISSYLKNEAINNVILFGRIASSEVYRFYNETHVLYAKLDPNYISAVPSKLYEYLATNKPIIYSGKGAAVQLLQKFDNNIYLCDDLTYKPVIQEVLKLIHSGNEISTKNRELIRENYIREDIIEKRIGEII